jgi:hypothetical protein
LPDTAEELRSVALALQVDPTKVLHFGKDAYETAVKGTDLSRYRIIAFATHGLVPGELDGPTQPALELSPPDVAGVPGDGLLTMEEILALKLDAFQSARHHKSNPRHIAFTPCSLHSGEPKLTGSFNIAHTNEILVITGRVVDPAAWSRPPRAAR